MPRVRRRLAALFAALLAALALGAAAARAASPCDPELDPVDGANGYQPRPAAMCEGLFVSRVGAPAIELVSLTRGRAVAGAAIGTWRLSVPEAPSDDAPVRLRAIGIPPGLYYRMDARVGPHAGIAWPAQRVLGAIAVPLDDIGIFAFYDDRTGTPVYLPVTVSAGATGATGRAGATGEISAADAGQDDTMVAELRPSTDIDLAHWRFVPARGGASVDAGWHEVELAHDRLTMRLPAGPGSLQIRWADQDTGSNRHASFLIGG